MPSLLDLARARLPAQFLTLERQKPRFDHQINTDVVLGTHNGLIGLAKVVAKEGAAHGVRANVICPGFVRTPLVDKQIPEQAKELGISEQEVVKNVMLKETVDGEFTTVDDVAQTALFLASFGSNALTGQSIVVSHGWFMQ
jgi:3-hydroxybutyrate dehydrogenase